MKANSNGFEELKLQLRKILTRHLNSPALWRGDFYRVAEPNRSEFIGKQSSAEQDPLNVWKMLSFWAENMIAASYGFQTYVLTLAARSSPEAVRRSLIDNAWEELGDVEYPSRSHYHMVCQLAKRLCGVQEQHIHSPRLTTSSCNHIRGHIMNCTSAPFLQGLGMIYFIEALTRIEFGRVLGAFIRWFPLGTGRNLEEFALKGGVGYFSSNIEADLKHQEDVEQMIFLTLQSMGYPNTELDGFKSELELIELGVSTSLNFRCHFMQGIYDAVFPEDTTSSLTPIPIADVSTAKFA